MAEGLAQLAMSILPPIALLISLPITLLAVTIGGYMETAKIWFRRNRPLPSAIELVGTPSTMKTARIVPIISRGLALRNKG